MPKMTTALYKWALSLLNPSPFPSPHQFFILIS